LPSSSRPVEESLTYPLPSIDVTTGGRGSLNLDVLAGIFVLSDSACVLLAE
jgi:hypothetical protein